MVALTTLIAQGRNGRFSGYLAGAFDADALPEEWEEPAEEDHEEVVQTRGGNWRTRNNLAAIH